MIEGKISGELAQARTAPVLWFGSVLGVLLEFTKLTYSEHSTNKQNKKPSGNFQATPLLNDQRQSLCDIIVQPKHLTEHTAVAGTVL